MKKGIYRMLAWSGIKKNQKLYLPYILTCAGTVMMCYIISFLAYSPAVTRLSGGNTAQAFLEMGFYVMAFFSLIFLFYTNSFLIRRRKKEFGLYNILGVGKKNLAVVLAIETLFIEAVTLAGGLLSGVFFSKLAETCIIKILGAKAGYNIRIDPGSMGRTAGLFLVIFALIFLNTLRQIHLTNPIELIHSENTGEKPPKANWAGAVLGAAILGTAYGMAVTIEDPVSAITWFFVIVIMVIIATYLLFITGSVRLCRLLQKNRAYYYQTKHFVSVSSMVYRMKRNGAGLASICILCTMVLVMMSSTICLYIGAEDNLRNRYSRNINIDSIASSVEMMEGDEAEKIKRIVEETVSENGTEQENVLTYKTAAFGGLLKGDRIIYDDAFFEDMMGSKSDICQIFLVPVSDYNRLMGKDEMLAPDEMMIYTTKELKYEGETIRLGDSETFRIVKKVDSFVKNGVDSMQIFPTVYLFVPDLEETVNMIAESLPDMEENPVSLHWYYAFDLPCEDETQIRIQEQLTDRLILSDQSGDASAYFHVTIEGAAKDRSGFYGMYGGLFFLGVLLGSVFSLAAVLIIYYKQISEGYEDQSRFHIMQKVGMTKEEIKKSINSQVLTVFFMPLITAGIHLAFAFPVIRKLLMIFGLMDAKLLIATTAVCYLVFAFFYLLIYRLTSGSYFRIVSGIKED